jgi:hypothetical protein
MNVSDLKILKATKDRLITGMTEYMTEADDAGYTDTDIKKCDEILLAFTDSLQKLDTSAADPEILKPVRQVVLSLNALNESVGGGLIETDQREDLCEYILFAAKQSGLKQEGDVTEEWREW